MLLCRNDALTVLQANKMDNPQPTQAPLPVSQDELQPFPISRFIHYGDFRFYYAYGNTPAEDFLENSKAGVKEPVILSLGCGDIRSCLYTIWKYFSPAHKDHRFNGVHFVLNDCSAAVLARNILFLYLCMQMPSGKRSQQEWVCALWAIWYSHELQPKHVHVLNNALKDLLTFSVNLQTWSEPTSNPLGNLVRFASRTTLHEVHKMWKMWHEKDVRVHSVRDMHKARMELLSSRRPGYSIQQLVEAAVGPILGYFMREYAPKERIHSMKQEVESYINTGCCFAESILNLASSKQTSLNFTFYERPDGKYTLHYTSLPYVCFFHTLQFLPATESETQIVEATQKQLLVAEKEIDQQPLLTNSIQQFATWLTSSAQVLQLASVGDFKISFSFECSDAVVFCQKLQLGAHIGTNSMFDLIYSSNLFDHVSPPNLVLSATPLLKEGGLLFATSLNYKTIESTGERYLRNCFGFNCKVLPLVCGVRCIGMDGEYTDSVTIHPEPVELRNITYRSGWPKLFIWQRVVMSPYVINDLSKNTELVAALESSIFRMLISLFENSGGNHTTNLLCTETAVALLLRFISNIEDTVDVTSFAFWQPLCSRLCKLRLLKPFLFQLQIQAFLHGLHFHLTMSESQCPLCSGAPLTSFFQQFSVKLNLSDELMTPAFNICLSKSTHVNLEHLRQLSSLILMGEQSGGKYAYLNLVSDLKEVYFIDCITGKEVEGKLQLDFFLPRSLVAQDYNIVVIAHLVSRFGNLPLKVMQEKLANVQISPTNYAFQHVSALTRRQACVSSFGQVIQHCGNGDCFESIVAFSGDVHSALENGKLSTQLVSETEIQISCGQHAFTLCYPFLIAYNQIAIKFSRKKGTVTVLTPRKQHCFYKERPLFLASPDIQASLPPAKLPKDLCTNLIRMQFTNKDRQIKHQPTNALHVLPALLQLKETIDVLFWSAEDYYHCFVLSGRLVGVCVVHNLVFDLHRRSPAIDLSFYFPDEPSLLLSQLEEFFHEGGNSITIKEAEYELLKKVFSYFALRTSPTPALSVSRMGILTRHSVAHHFTRAVVYPLYTDPDTWAQDMNLTDLLTTAPTAARQTAHHSNLRPQTKELPNPSGSGKHPAELSTRNTTACSYCHKTSDKMKTCQRCKNAHYCNRDCQRGHWSVHKSHCQPKPVESTATEPSINMSTSQVRLDPVSITERQATSLPSAGRASQPGGTNDEILRCSFCHDESPTLKACTGCGRAHYCNKDHQTKHWIEHKEICLQLRETNSKEATPTTQPQHSTADYCSGCSKSSRSLRKCRCHMAAYCSVECQRNDWPRHRDQCTAKPQRK